MSEQALLLKLVNYKKWANEKVFNCLQSLDEEELLKKRDTRFGNILHTLNHVLVIDDIFKHHLLAQAHGYTAKDTENSPSLAELWEKQHAMDDWYRQYTENLDAQALGEPVNFQFINGDKGSMTRAEIVLHVVNHGTYHRGFVGDMMYQASRQLPATDMPVFFR